MKPLALHDIHARAGAQFGELGGREVVRAYRPLTEEYSAARDGAALTDLSAREWLRLTGEDRVSFLHGMVTNDVKGLAEGAAVYTAMVTNKGAMVSDARIWRRSTDLLLDLEPGLLNKVKAFLETYLISEDVELSDASGEFGLLGVLGPLARPALREALGADLSDLALNQSREVRVEGGALLAVGADLLAQGGVDLLVPAPLLERVWTRLVDARSGTALVPIGFEALEVLRVEAGIPRYGQDMEEKTLPLEANLERGIHYAKGCYIGQEVIARATFRGHVNRKLVGLLLGAAQPAPRTELSSGGKKIGWLTSVVFSPALGQHVALGYAHRDFLAPGTALELPGQAGKAVVCSLPMASR